MPTRDSISASPEDGRTGRRPNAGGRAAQRASKRGGSGGGASFMTGLILTLLVAGLGIAGWFIMNQHKLLTAATEQRAQAEERLKVLEDRLRATDDLLTDADSDTKEKLGYWESEIRKVWDIAYATNRPWIKENQAALSAHNSQLETLQVKLDQLSADLAEQSNKIAQSATAVAALEPLGDQLSELAEGQTKLEEKLGAEIKSLAGSGLSERVVRNEQAVAAIDAYRVQLNGRLTDLQQRVDQLRSSTPVPSPQ